MTPVQKTLAYNLKQRIFIRLRNPKTNTLMQIAHFPFCRVPEASGREPEGYRKVTGRITCSFLFYRSSGSSRKVPGRLAGSLLGAVVLHGSRKVPEGFRKGVRKGKIDLSSQVSHCESSDSGQPAVVLLQG